MTIQERREKLHLTQTDLATRSGLSLRTIQRVEAGQIPKGYTLTALAKALDTTEDELKGIRRASDTVKWINLSVLSGLILPYGNILAPAILTYRSKEDNGIGKDILAFQIVFTVLLSLALILSPLMISSFHLSSKLIFFIFITAMLVNAAIVLINARALAKSGALCIKLNFSIL